jgi:hypothetical protein
VDAAGEFFNVNAGVVGQDWHDFLLG